MGPQDSDPEGSRPTPLPLRDVPGIQQRSQRLQRAQQVPVQEQALCKFTVISDYNASFFLPITTSEKSIKMYCETYWGYLQDG